MGETWASLDGDKDSSRAMSIKDSRCSKGSTKAIFPSGANSLRLSRNKSGRDRVSVCQMCIRDRHYTSVDTHYYSYIAEGMRGAVTGTAYGGTCRGAALPDIEVCGKTGTSENPHGKDHSIFMGFAPYQKPKVAIAVFVENAGFGATYAVPIGKLMLEKYLKGEISEANKATEEYIMNAVILPHNAL